MKPIESTRFIFDASGLLSVLEPQFGESKRTLPGRKMSQLAKRGMIIIPHFAAREAEAHSTKTKQWLDRNARYIEVPNNLRHSAYAPTVKMRAETLPGFTASRADVEGASVALALVGDRLDVHNNVTNYIVVQDIAYEAACILLGIATVRPEAFVEAFGALNLPDRATPSDQQFP